MAIDMNRTTIALPGQVSGEIWQKTQESSAVMGLARRIALPGLGVTIPVITGDPEAAWVTSTAVRWWLRSPYASYSVHFVSVGTDGAVGISRADLSLGFAPGFCV